MTLQLAAHTSNIISCMPSITNTCWRAWQLLPLALPGLLSPDGAAAAGQKTGTRAGWHVPLRCAALAGAGPRASSVRPVKVSSKIPLLPSPSHPLPVPDWAARAAEAPAERGRVQILFFRSFFHALEDLLPPGRPLHGPPRPLAHHNAPLSHLPLA